MKSVVQFIPRVTMLERAHLPSTWRDPIGKPLSSARITYYARLGRYGKEMQQRVQGRLSLKPCCHCHGKQAAFLRFSYLPKSGWYCDVCRASFKLEHEKAEKADKEVRARVRAANKAIEQEKQARKEALAVANAIDFLSDSSLEAESISSL